MGKYIALPLRGGSSMTTHRGNNEWVGAERTQFTNERGNDLWQTTNATASHSDGNALTSLEHMSRIRKLHLLVDSGRDIFDRRWHWRIVAHPRHLRNWDRVEELV